MTKIFISYRREDTLGHAGRLYDRLQKEFGQENVFIDMEALEPGEDFVDAIHQRLAGCDVVLVFIGRRWLTVVDEHGRRRLDDEGDYVRLELQTALERQLRTIPVLVERASMPRQEELPQPLRPLARRHAIELSDVRWAHDAGALIEKIKASADAAGLATPSTAVETESPVGEDAAPRFPLMGRRGWALALSIGVMAITITVVASSKIAYACATLGLMHANGEGGMMRDSARAVALYQRACDGGDGEGCNNLGVMYRRGSGGLPRDDERAVALYQRACDKGLAVGCGNLGGMYASGRGGLPRDDVSAAELYRRACEGGVLSDCTYLGRMYERGSAD